jgi:hypothetical protein
VLRPARRAELIATLAVRYRPSRKAHSTCGCSVARGKHKVKRPPSDRALTDAWLTERIRHSSQLNLMKSLCFARHVRRLPRSIPAGTIAQMRGRMQEMRLSGTRAGARSS